MPTNSAFRLEKLEPSPAVFPIITGYTATEYETVQIVWKEKVRHDLARPPTIFEGKFRGMKARTWGGPYRSVQTVKRKDCPVPLTVRGTQALVSFAPLAFKLFCAARQNAVLRRSSFPSP